MAGIDRETALANSGKEEYFSRSKVAVLNMRGLHIPNLGLETARDATEMQNLKKERSATNRQRTTHPTAISILPGKW
jgi:hypothetical protein